MAMLVMIMAMTVAMTMTTTTMMLMMLMVIMMTMMMVMDDHDVIQEMTGVDEVHDSQIDGLAAAWKGSCRVDQSGQLVIDRQTFLSIMSRYVKAHMNDYMLLQGLLEMTKTKPEELRSSKLTLETLAEALNTSGENAEVRVYRHAVAKLRSASLRQSMEDSAHESVMDVVQEIVWAHKPLVSAGGDSNLSSLDFTDLVAAAMPTELRPKAGATLPPKPPKKAARSHKDGVAPESRRHAAAKATEKGCPQSQGFEEVSGE
ncbi:hypothetical protein AK812_SmicGene43972 [Symbiodinium microadriaticum]|uniref:Uncharacterized protein n=1 Tax=Symbiodinium microadriaticum TaxID=2951 RepID=A0A1Q9BZM8_SYMMI|nr:hypothetical protein AK812_SmicGene43972 [Symbiodinium microadriaticum]